MGTESSGGYTITFDKNTFLSLGVDVYGKSENLNEEKKRKKRAEHGLFVRLFFWRYVLWIYDLRRKAYPQWLCIRKNRSWIWRRLSLESAFRKDINHTVNKIAAPNGLELFYDAKMKKPVSDDEMFSTIGKKYYARPKILTERSFVVVMVEVDYKVPTKTEKFMTGYGDRYVTDYAL